MTAPASKAPAVKAYLVTALTAVMDQDTAGSDPTPLVSYNEPDTSDSPSDLVVVGKVTRTFRPTRMVGSGGQWWGNEDFDVEIHVSVLNNSPKGSQGCEERFWHLIGLIEAAVRNDPSLGGLVIQANPSTSDCETGWNDTVWEAAGVLTVHIEAAQ